MARQGRSFPSHHTFIGAAVLATVVLSTAGASDSAPASDTVARTAQVSARAAVDAAPAADVVGRTGLFFVRAATDAAPASDAAVRAGQVFTRSVTDAAPAGDVAARTGQPFGRAATDAAPAADVAAGAATAHPSATDSAPAGDAAARAAQHFARAASDAAPAGDAVTRVESLPVRTASDAAPAGDAVTRTAQVFVRATSDAAPAGDVTARAAQTFARAATDAAPASDAVTRSVHAALAATDSAPATDAVSRAGQVQVRSATDAAPAADVVGRSVRVAAVDSAPASDVATRVVRVFRSASEAAPATDLVTIGVQVRSVVDSAPAVDVATRTAQVFVRSVADAAPASDVAVHSGQYLPRAAADAAPAGDSVTRTAQVFTRACTDAAPATDVVGRTGEVATRSAVDAAPATDSVARAAQHVTRTAPDAAPATDAAVRPAQTFTRAASDAAPATDTATRPLAGVPRAATDSAPASDAVSRTVQVFVRSAADFAPAADVVTCTETPSARTCTDAAPASDVVSRTAQVFARAVSDSAPAADTARIGASSVGATDSAPATDTVTRAAQQVLRSASDAAPATDTTSSIFTHAAAPGSNHTGVGYISPVGGHLDDTIPTTSPSPAGFGVLDDTNPTTGAGSVTRTGRTDNTGPRTGAGVATAPSVTGTFAAADAAPATDVVGRAAQVFVRSATDSAPATDVARVGSFVVGATDNAPATDVVTRTAQTFLRAATDAAPAADVAVRAGVVSARSGSDSAPAADSVARTAQHFIRAATDSAPASDAAYVGTQLRVASDTAPATDSVARAAQQVARSAADGAPATDVVGRAAQSLTRAASDAAPATDAVTRTGLVETRSVSDAAPATDVVGRAAQVFVRSAADFAPAADTVFSGAYRTAVDTAPASDVVTRAAQHVARSATDSAPATDTTGSIFVPAPVTGGTGNGALTGVGHLDDTIPTTSPSPAGFGDVDNTIPRTGAGPVTRTGHTDNTVPATGGGSHTVAPAGPVLTSTAASDTAPASDSVTRGAQVFVRSVADAAPASDVAGAPVSFRTVVDSAPASDAVTRTAQTFLRAVTDAAPAADAATRTVQVFVRSAADSAPAADVAGVAARFVRAATDSAPATDVVGRTAQVFVRAAADAAPASDAAGITFVRFVVDSAPATDTATRAAQVFVRAVPDTAPAADVVSRAAQVFVRGASDAAPAGDTARSAVVLTRAATDATPATDAVTRTVQVFVRSATDAAPASDSATFGAVLRSAADSAPATDSVARAVQHVTRTASDAAPAVDTATRTVQVFVRSAADSAPAVDGVSAGVQHRTATDSAPATDSVIRTSQVGTRAATDIAPAADAVTRTAQTFLRTATDAAPASDTSTVTNPRAATDSAPASDVAARTAQAFIRAATDAAPASDAVHAAFTAYPARVANKNWPLVGVDVDFGTTVGPPTAPPTVNRQSVNAAYRRLSARKWQIRRGRQYELDQVQAGQATIEIPDPLELLNPDNTGSPFNTGGDQIMPYRPMWIWAMWPNQPGSGNLYNDAVTNGIDASFEGGSGPVDGWAVPVNTLTTASFTPPAASMLVALVALGRCGATGSTINITDSAGGVWTKLADVGGPNRAQGETAIFYRYTASSPGPITVTATFGSATPGSGTTLAVRVLVGASATAGNQAQGYRFGSTNATVPVTTSAVGSLVYGISNQPTADTTFTANAATTAIATVRNSADTAAVWVQTTPTGTGGSISTVGTLTTAKNTAGGTTHAVPVTPAAVGNVLVLALQRLSTTTTVTSVTGGGVTTWTQVAGRYTDATHSYDIWMGPVTTAGSATATVTYSGSLSANSATGDVQEFSSTYGASAVWGRDGTKQAGVTNTTSTTVTFPSLTPAAAGELYIGYALVAGTGSAGATSGYTYRVDTLSNLVAFNPAATSSAQAPTGVQAPTGTSTALAVLLTASGPVTVTLGGTWGVAGSGLVQAQEFVRAVPTTPITEDASTPPVVTGATFGPSVSQAMIGAQSLKIIQGGSGATFGVLAQRGNVTAPAITYTASAYVYPTGGASVAMSVTDANGTVHTSTVASAQNVWTRIFLVWTSVDTLEPVTIFGSGVSNPTYYVDGMMLEFGALLSPFTLAGPTQYPLFTGYVERFPTTYDMNGIRAIRPLAAVDALAILSRTSISQSYALEITQDTPQLIMKMDDGAAPPLITGQPQGYGTVTQPTGGQVNFGGDTLPDGSPAVSIGQQIQTNQAVVSTTLYAGSNYGDTSIQLAATVNVGDYLQIDAGTGFEEWCQVTAITGAAAPFTATITESPFGIVGLQTSHPTGATVVSYAAQDTYITTPHHSSYSVAFGGRGATFEGWFKPVVGDVTMMLAGENLTGAVPTGYNVTNPRSFRDTFVGVQSLVNGIYFVLNDARNGTTASIPATPDPAGSDYSNYPDNTWHYYAVKIYPNPANSAQYVWEAFVDGNPGRVAGIVGAQTAKRIRFNELAEIASTFSGPPQSTLSAARVAYYPYALSDDRILAHSTRGRGNLGELSGARVARLLAKYWGGSSIVAPGKLQMAADFNYNPTVQTVDKTTGAGQARTMLDVLQEIQESERGLVYADRFGRVIFEDRVSRYVTQTSLFTLGENPTNVVGVEYPYSEYKTDFDPTYTFTQADLTSPTNSDFLPLVNPVGLKRFGQRVVTQQVQAEYDFDLEQAGIFYLTRYATPKTRLSQLTLKPAANPALWPIVLGLEISQRITTTRRSPAGVTVTSDYYVEQIQTQVDIETGDWTVTLQLSPVFVPTAWVLGDPTYGVLNTTTVPIY